MATGTKVCKVCGKEYECCKTLRRIEGVFRWQDVACCVEHGQEYLNQVMIARGEKKQSGEAEAIEPTKEPEIIPQKKAARHKKTEE